MKCYFCNITASAKVGEAKGNIWKGLIGKRVWDKREIYVCKIHYQQYRKHMINMDNVFEKRQDRHWGLKFKNQLRKLKLIK